MTLATRLFDIDTVRYCLTMVYCDMGGMAGLRHDTEVVEVVEVEGSGGGKGRVEEWSGP